MPRICQHRDCTSKIKKRERKSKRYHEIKCSKAEKRRVIKDTDTKGIVFAIIKREHILLKKGVPEPDVHKLLEVDFSSSSELVKNVISREHEMIDEGIDEERVHEILIKEFAGNNPGTKEKKNNPGSNPKNPGESLFPEQDPKTLEDFYKANKQIEEFIDQNPDEEFTAAQKAFAKKYYTGYGGLDKFMSREEISTGILFEFFTPDPIVEKMWGLAYKYGYKDGSVLEPAAGTGAFLSYAPSAARVVAYEINPYSARILKEIYSNADIKTEKFERIFVKDRKSIKNKTQDLEKFDLVIGNPPYGKFSGMEAAWEKPYTKSQNYIDYFIFRSLDLLKPSGLLVMVVGAEVATGGKLFLDKDVDKSIKEKSILLDKEIKAENISKPWWYSDFKTSHSTFKRQKLDFLDPKQILSTPEGINFYAEGQNKTLNDLNLQIEEMSSPENMDKMVGEIIEQREKEQYKPKTVVQNVKDFEKLNYLLSNLRIPHEVAQEKAPDLKTGISTEEQKIKVAAAKARIRIKLKLAGYKRK